MHDMPLVSVVIPTYNQADMLIEAIDSVLNQTYTHIEIIVVDDGSTDNTYEKLEPYIENRKILYLHQKNQRQAAAKNKGVTLAHGALIAFMDHDDLWEPKKLEKQVPLFANERVGLVYCGAREIDLSGYTLWEKGGHKFRRGAIFDYLLFSHFITNSSVVVRRSCLERTGFFEESLYGVDDIHLWLRICHDFEADFVPDIHVACRNHDMNMKKDSNIIPEKRFLALINIFERFGLNQTSNHQWRKLNADYQFFLGFRHKESDRLRALGYYFKSLQYQPRLIQLVAMIKLFIPGYYSISKRIGRK